MKEVIRIRQIIRLPHAPGFVLGIIDPRGEMIPIIGLREKSGLARQEAAADTRVIVVDVEGRLIGMMVRSASRAERIPAGQIAPHRPAWAGGRSST